MPGRGRVLLLVLALVVAGRCYESEFVMITSPHEIDDLHKALPDGSVVAQPPQAGAADQGNNDAADLLSPKHASEQQQQQQQQQKEDTSKQKDQNQQNQQNNNNNQNQQLEKQQGDSKQVGFHPESPNGPRVTNPAELEPAPGHGSAATLDEQPEGSRGGDGKKVYRSLLDQLDDDETFAPRAPGPLDTPTLTRVFLLLYSPEDAAAREFLQHTFAALSISRSHCFKLAAAAVVKAGTNGAVSEPWRQLYGRNDYSKFVLVFDDGKERERYNEELVEFDHLLYHLQVKCGFSFPNDILMHDIDEISGEVAEDDSDAPGITEFHHDEL